MKVDAATGRSTINIFANCIMSTGRRVAWVLLDENYPCTSRKWIALKAWFAEAAWHVIKDLALDMVPTTSAETWICKKCIFNLLSIIIRWYS